MGVEELENLTLNALFRSRSLGSKQKFTFIYEHSFQFWTFIYIKWEIFCYNRRMFSQLFFSNNAVEIFKFPSAHFRIKALILNSNLVCTEGSVGCKSVRLNQCLWKFLLFILPPTTSFHSQNIYYIFVDVVSDMSLNQWSTTIVNSPQTVPCWTSS